MSSLVQNFIVLISQLLLSAFVYAQTPPWQRINPLPFECTVNDSEVLTGGRILGVGDLATIVYSDDFGTTWNIMYKPANAPYKMDLTSVCFVDDENGWACGGYKTIVQTIDGGNTWTLLYQGSNHPNRKYSDIEFVNNTEGFLIFDSYTDTLFKTQDGGISWDMVSGLEDYSFKYIEFVSSDIGLMYGEGGYFLKTVDAGNSWLKIEILDSIENVSINDMYFIDQQTGFVGASVYYTTDIDHYLLKTVDGGSSWKITTREFDYAVSNIAFSNADTGYTVGYVPWYRNNIMRTVDRGENWELITDTIGYWHLNNFCTDFDGKVMLFGRKGQVYKSFDYGSSWIKSFSNPIIGFDVLSSVILDDSSIIVSSEGGVGGVPWYRNLISFDRGNSWTRTEDYYGIVYDLHFLNDNVGFYCGGYGYSGGKNFVYKTLNGGLDWDYTELADDDAILTRIEFINDSIGFIGGMSDYYGCFILYKTTDQGENWNEVNIDYYTVGDVAEFDFYNDSSAIIAGYIHPPNGQIIRTNDCGNTWFIDSLAFDSYFTHVHFMNPDTGILFGMYKICKTIDGGDSWYQVDFSYNDFVTPKLKYGFAGEGTGYLRLQGHNNLMFKTEDYGDTWYEIEELSTSIIHTISFFSPDEGIVAGEESIIFKTSTGGIVQLPERESEIERQMDIYPNPTQSNFTVIIPEGYENGLLSIYDLQGRLISAYTYTDEKELSLQVDFQSGVYIVMYENAKSRLSGKLVVMEP